MPNLFDQLPTDCAAEHFQELMSRPGLRIERIVSNGQSSPPGFWYDQAQDEWVLVLQGEAKLLIAGEPGPRILRPGDYADIPAHRRHRVEATAAPTIWLAVHYGATDAA